MTGFAELVGCDRPVQLAGMGGGLSDARLATAVSAAGGLGMIGAAGYSTRTLAAILDGMPVGLTFGVNFLVPFVDRAAVAIAADRARVVEFFYGEPDAELVDIVHRGGALAGWQVGSGREARTAAGSGCDFVVAQGTEAGGHVRGSLGLLQTLAETAAATSLPLVAAGGIGTAHDVVVALDAGASAVRIGTRFLASTEASTHPLYVDALIASTADDTVLTEAFSVGWPDAPHRVLRSSIDAAQTARGDIVATITVGDVEIPLPRWTTLPPTVAVRGDIAALPMYAGTSVDAVRRRAPAAHILADLVSAL